ncbi:MAG: tetratricopeptide repeat protein [Bacteroidota bacterium]|nr:tetratricopeptide repeat protein [Bacteroidota bacterium]
MTSRRFGSFVSALLILLIFWGIDQTNAQSIVSRYGKDSISCVTNLALYREFYRQKNYKDALPHWRYVFNNCPRATENILINGANMYNSFIQAEKDSAIKRRLVDTLFMIYDTRIKYFGNEGRHLASKANDLLNADSTRSFEAYGMLKRTVDLQKDNTEESTLINYYRAAIASFKSGKITNDEMAELFNQAESIIDDHINNTAGQAEIQKWTQLKKMADKSILPLLKCSDYATIFAPRLKAKPDDPVLLKRVSEVLFRNGCTDDSLYLFSLERLNAMGPDPNTAFLIAREYLKRKNIPQAVTCLTDVAGKVKDDVSKAKCHYYLGVIYADSKDYTNARANALKAIQLKSGYGEPYMLIADCYAQSALDCGGDNVTIRAAFWCAVDKLNQAKKTDPKLESTVNKLITQYSRNFPTKQMLLNGKLKIGSKYLVGCWINETTIVRSNLEKTK